MNDQTNKQPSGPINVPRFNVNGFEVAASETEISVLGSSQVFGIKDGKISIGQNPVLQLGMSPGAAKELVHILSNTLRQIEEQSGVIDTQFLKSAREKSPK